jgi:hypothetical protein
MLGCMCFGPVNYSGVRLRAVVHVPGLERDLAWGMAVFRGMIIPLMYGTGCTTAGRDSADLWSIEREAHAGNRRTMGVAGGWERTSTES